jgi:hypothetical protein
LYRKTLICTIDWLVETGIEARTILKQNSEKAELEGMHRIHVAQNRVQGGLL